MGNKLIVGGGLIFDNAVIVDGEIEKFESLTGTELQYDTLDFTIESDIFSMVLADSNDAILLTSDDMLLALDGDMFWQYGIIAEYYYNDELQGKFYIENVKRIGASRYKITAISSVGILANTKHYGGIYEGDTLETVIDGVIGGQMPYTIDPALAKEPIYGWLPIATRRENLHQVLFAMSASIRKDKHGDMYITALSKDTAKSIPDSRIFLGGSVDYPQASKSISLLEHAYISRNTDEEVVLYDKEIASDLIKTPNGVVVRGGLILFDGPMHDLTITGSSILESGVNYAVLAPTAQCELKGKKYTHTVKQISRPEVPEEGSEENENTVTIDTATLVSLANSENVANRLADYYGSAKKVTMDILQGDEATGDAVTFSDPFNEATEGLISSLNMKFSGILRSTAEIIADYDPPDIGNFYDNVAILTGNDHFDIPSGVEKVRVILIGGGSSGHKGEDGSDGIDDAPNPGGVGGIGGDGGKILIFSLATDGVTRITANCGTGNTQGDGQKGDATIVTLSNGDEYTSDDGTVSSIGFIEIFSGNSYGYPGKDVSTIRGASGGYLARSEQHRDGYDYTDDDGTWTGGVTGADYRVNVRRRWTGGMGGGAAHGSNGQPGTDASYDEMGISGDGGNGANGANATVYGCGGDGGHGGGGGGCRPYEFDNDGEPVERGQAGHGGTGGNGGNGAPGCVIIYY